MTNITIAARTLLADFNASTLCKELNVSVSFQSASRQMVTKRQRSLSRFLYFVPRGAPYTSTIHLGGGGGAVAQWIEWVTSGQEIVGSIPAVAPARYWLGRCQYNVTG